MNDQWFLVDVIGWKCHHFWLKLQIRWQWGFALLESVRFICLDTKLEWPSPTTQLTQGIRFCGSHIPQLFRNRSVPLYSTRSFRRAFESNRSPTWSLLVPRLILCRCFHSIHEKQLKIYKKKLFRFKDKI